MHHTKNTYKPYKSQPDMAARGVGFHRDADYDEALERNVLGVLIIEPAAYSAVYRLLTSDCFYNPDHRRVYTAINTLWQQGHVIDIMILNRHLCDDGATTIGDGPTAWYLSTLIADVVTSAHLPQWCALLRRLATRRQLIALTAGGLCNDDVDDTINAIQQQLQQAIQTQTPDDWVDAATAARLLTQQMDEAIGNKMNGISTTFATIDNANGGLRPGQLVVIGARPSAGKSALAAGIAAEAAKQGHRVGIISLEMGAAELMGRILSRESHISHSTIDRGTIETDLQRSMLQQSLDTLAALPISFADHAQMTIHDIRARAEKLKRDYNLALLIIDYLQLIEEAGSQHRSREQGVSAISRGLKLLAMNLEIPIIALSQLNRESENRANKRPTMGDLRESGAIEQDADIVMLLHRDWRCGIHTDAHGNSTEHQADLIVAKWRNGITLDLKLHFTPATMTFTERQ
jgi:replicative DNA helicase